jgi:hypothetical protein
MLHQNCVRADLSTARHQIHQEIGRLRSGLHELAQEPLRREEAHRLERIRRRDAKHDADLFLKHDWLSSKPFPRPRPSFGNHR